MHHTRSDQQPLGRIGGLRRQPVSLAPTELVKSGPLAPGRVLPLVIEPALPDVDLAGWASANRGFVNERLLAHGALLFRGFGVGTAAEFEKAASALCPDLFGDYGDLPREGVGGRVYGATPYPPDLPILFHNEGSHLPRWPQKQFFCCLQVAPQGGETPLLDCREVCRRLDRDVLDRFAEKGLLYIRNFVPGVDVSWQDFFHTDDRRAVEETCAREGMAAEWTAGGVLRVSRRARAVVRHPKTNELVFFNQVQLHHPFCLPPQVREALLSMFDPRDLPRLVCYGDGSPIEDEVMARLDALYWETSVTFPWQQGDLVLVDNMLVAHARKPYAGPRKILVAMGDMTSGPPLN
jgi:alpha-ketoglutarate-dependent taurine dioxygenase